MMRKFFVLIVGFLFFKTLSAQVDFPIVLENMVDCDSIKEDKLSLSLFDNLNINQDSRLQKMVNWHVENNKKRDGINGYRVEIFFSSALNAMELAENKKKEFLEKFPEYDVHIKFSAPNFKVRVGDFRTKNEALKLLKTIQKSYSGAFIVPDIIDFPLLKQNYYERSN